MRSSPEKDKGPRRVESTLSKADLQEFHEFLVQRKRLLQSSVRRLEDEACRKGVEAAGDLSTLPLHLADMGTDTFEQDTSLGLIENESEEIKEIRDALARIEDGSFGVCEGCQEMIPLERLRAIPYTRLCVPCKRKEEEAA